jgi:hypothetical protein
VHAYIHQGSTGNGETADYYLTASPIDDDNITYGLGHIMPWSARESKVFQSTTSMSFIISLITVKSRNSSLSSCVSYIPQTPSVKVINDARAQWICIFLPLS